MSTTLPGAHVVLRPATVDDVSALAKIRATPEVYQRWGGGDDLVDAVAENLADPEVRTYVVEHADRVVGAIQWGEEPDPEHEGEMRPTTTQVIGRVPMDAVWDELDDENRRALLAATTRAAIKAQTPPQQDLGLGPITL